MIEFWLIFFETWMVPPSALSENLSYIWQTDNEEAFWLLSQPSVNPIQSWCDNIIEWNHQNQANFQGKIEGHLGKCSFNRTKMSLQSEIIVGIQPHLDPTKEILLWEECMRLVAIIFIYIVYFRCYQHSCADTYLFPFRLY